MIGNATALTQLRSAVKQPRHAYLFVGPEHLGKATAARKFAAALLCEKADGPCGTCNACALLEAGNHPDYIEMAEDSKAGIDEVRALQRDLSLRPHTGSRRVAVLPDAERLGGPAQNALLKLLEEPPEHAVIILTAVTPARLLPTTVSRCQQVRFQVPGPGEASAELEAAMTAADRRPGLAVTLAADPEALQARQEWAEQLGTLPRASTVERLNRAKELAANEDLPKILDTWITLVRAALALPVESESPVATKLRNDLGQDVLAEWYRRLFAARRRLRYNPNVQLLTEQLLLRLAN
jgi:DNA polymerase-3 subunit delta'